MFIMNYDCSTADIHVAIDGNFHHRHQRSSGDCPEFYDPSFFIAKTEVDATGERITLARAGSSRRKFVKVPTEAIDGCEASFEAANEKQVKSNEKRFDDTGLMALVCRQDVPLYLCNITTPGEPQKYFIALLLWLMLHTPAATTFTTFYDVNCVTWRVLMRVRRDSTLGWTAPLTLRRPV